MALRWSPILIIPKSAPKFLLPTCVVTAFAVFSPSLWLTLLVLIAGLIWQFRQLKQLEQQYKTLNETQLGHVLNHSPVPMFVLNREHEVLYWNKACEQVFGISAATILGTKRQWEVFYDAPRPVLSDLVMNNDLAALKHYYDGKFFLDGMLTGAFSAEDYFPKLGRWLRFTAVALKDSKGEVIGAIETLLDINETRAATTALQQANEKAMAAAEAKAQFLANMSHEIRTPLNAIIGLTELSLDSELKAKQYNYLSKIKNTSETLLNVVNDILDFSKIEAGKLTLERLPFDLDGVLNRLTDIHGRRAEEQGIELAYDIDPQITHLLIGDAFRLGQVLSNLLGNALKFSAGGSVVLSVRRRELATNSAELHFAVQDEGIGLTTAQQEQLFTAFNQADNSMTRRYGGTGLGLAICKRLVGLMQGKIWVESDYGKGSCFQFTARFGVAEHGFRHGVAELTQIMQPYAGRKVLIVDDTALARHFLANQVQQLGLVTDCVASGEAALAAVAANDAPDYLCCLVDWRMKDIDGLATIRQLRQLYLRTGKTAPLIFIVTAYSHDQALQNIDVAIDGFLSKPTSTKHFYAEIAPHLGLPELCGAGMFGRRTADRVSLAAYQGAEVLLVEDIEINQEVMLDLLEGAGLKVRVANNGSEAIAAVIENRPDCVLMDCQMPVLDGYEATRRIRQLQGFADLPIIAVTANAMNQDREKVLAAGMNAYIPKPINVNELFAELARWLPKRSPSTANDSSADTPAEPEPLVLPELPGIDATAGLMHVSGKLPLYIKVLTKFRESQGRHFGHDCRLALADEQWSEAVRLAHSLKGVSRTLGAYNLGDLAWELEQSLRDRNKQASLDNLGKALAALNEVTAGLAQLPVLPETPPRPSSTK